MLTATVVIVTYNSSDVLPACARALHQLVVPGGYELVIVDNASHDASVAVARQCWPQAIIVQNTVNRGFAAAVNQGVAAGSGRVVALLNPDTEVDAHWLTALVDALDSDATLGVVGSAVLDVASGELTHSGGVVDAVTFRTTHTHDVITGVTDVPYVTGAGMALRRDDWQVLRGFDEGFFPAYFEDLDLCRRVQARGQRCVVVPASQLRHHESTATGKHSGAFYYYYHRNRWRMIVKARANGTLAANFVMREAELLSQTNILDRSVALLVARMGLPTAQSGLPDEATQAMVLSIGTQLRVLQGDAYADPAHWAPALQMLLGVDAFQAQAASLLAQKLSPNEAHAVLWQVPDTYVTTPLYQQLFGSGWVARLRTRLVGVQFVQFVETMRQQMVGQRQHAIAMLHHVANTERLHIETMLRQAFMLADISQR